MAGKAIGISMNYGFPGTYARTPDDIVTSRKLSGSEDVAFGTPVAVKSDGTFEPVGASFTADKFGGIALRIVKQATAYDNQNESVYKAGEMVNALSRGAIAVKCNVGTPTAGGAVYVRIAANEDITDGVVGGLEAAEDSTNTVKLTNVQWTDGNMDANRVAEVTVLYRLNA